MSRCHTGAGRAGQGRAARGRPGAAGRGEWLRPRPPPVLCPGPPRPAARSRPSVEQGAAAAAPGRPRGVGVSGRLGSGSSSLQRLPRQRSHHLDPACLSRCCRCEGPEAAPAVTRERRARAAACVTIRRGRAASARAEGGGARLGRCHGSRPPGLGFGGHRAGDAGLQRTGDVRRVLEPGKHPVHLLPTA